jgi:hypothetical protein
MSSQPVHEPALSETGFTLPDAILIALKDGQPHPRPAVRACAEELTGPAPAAQTPAQQQDDFARAVLTLQRERRITVTRRAPDSTGPETVLCLVPPAPDDRFAIDPVFRDLLPPPSPGELALLERQLLREGCRDPLVTWTHAGRTVLVDGHTRLSICRRHRLTYELVPLDQPHPEAVIEWIWLHHCSRRNFTPEAASYARGRLFRAQKLGHGGDRRGRKPHSETLQRSAQALAVQLKVTRATVFRDAAYAQALDRIAAVCGSEIRTKVLCRVVPLRRGSAVRLANKDEADMKRLVAELLAGKKLILAPRSQRLVRLELPRGKPAEQAEVLIERLGPKAARKLHEALTSRLKAKGD